VDECNLARPLHHHIHRGHSQFILIRGQIAYRYLPVLIHVIKYENVCPDAHSKMDDLDTKSVSDNTMKPETTPQRNPVTLDVRLQRASYSSVLCFS
jgi:hypothetical protein